MAAAYSLHYAAGSFPVKGWIVTVLLGYGLFNVMKACLILYQTRFQPHPYYGHPDPAVGTPTDPGGEQVYGSFNVIDRISKKRIVEEGRSDFSLVSSYPLSHRGLHGPSGDIADPPRGSHHP